MNQFFEHSALGKYQSSPVIRHSLRAIYSLQASHTPKASNSTLITLKKSTGSHDLPRRFQNNLPQLIRLDLVSCPFSFPFRFPILGVTAMFRVPRRAHHPLHGVFMEKFAGDIQVESFPSSSHPLFDSAPFPAIFSTASPFPSSFPRRFPSTPVTARLLARSLAQRRAFESSPVVHVSRRALYFRRKRQTRAHSSLIHFSGISGAACLRLRRLISRRSRDRIPLSYSSNPPPTLRSVINEPCPLCDMPCKWATRVALLWFRVLSLPECLLSVKLL